MKQRVEGRLRVLEARVALLEPTDRYGFTTIDPQTRVDLLAEKLARTHRRIRYGVLGMVLTSTAFAVASVVLTRGR